jgi:dCTP deaminase
MTMSVLVRKKLLARLTETDPAKRLVVAPLLEPTEQLSGTQASIDVRLGCDFRLASAANINVLDELADAQTNPFVDLPRLYNNLYVPLGGGVTIHPHQLVLAHTLEYIRLPQDLMAYVVGRSSFGRLGLIVATAIGVHPNFYGPLTLEIRNLGEAPLRLYPGQTIAQLFFHTLDPFAEQKLWGEPDVRFGTFAPSNEPVPNRVSSKRTSSRLRAFRKRRDEAENELRAVGQIKDAP